MKTLKLYSNLIHKAEKRGRENERQRFAGELHDSLAQKLSLAKMYLNTLDSIDSQSDQFNLFLSEINDLVDESLNEVRTISHTIDKHEDDIGVCSIIRNLAVKYNRLDGPQIDFKSNIIGFSLGCKKSETCITRVIQEFIQNSFKHANASQIEIAIEDRKSSIVIMLIDNGCGFTTNEFTHIYGLKSVIRRLRKINAKFNYKSSPNTGTRLIIEVYGKSS